MASLQVLTTDGRQEVVSVAILHKQDNGDVVYAYFGRHLCSIRVMKADGTWISDRQVSYQEIVKELDERSTRYERGTQDISNRH